MNIVTNSDVLHLGTPKRFFEYAYAYLDAAFILCEKMTSENAACNWPNASAILMLGAHTTELFIKGAILYRDPTTVKIYNSHTINWLCNEYKKLYTEPSFKWDIPFNSEYDSAAEYLDITKAEVEVLKKKEPVPSLLYRYPVDNHSNEWKGLLVSNLIPSWSHLSKLKVTSIESSHKLQSIEKISARRMKYQLKYSPSRG